MSMVECSEHRTIASFPDRDQYKDQAYVPYLCLKCGKAFLIIPFEAKETPHFEEYRKHILELAKKNIPRYEP